MATPIGTLGNVDSLTVGGQIFTGNTSNANLITLTGGHSSSTANFTFRSGNGTAGHQVAAGKTLTIYAVAGFVTAGLGYSILYSSNDVGMGTNTAFTGAVYMAGYGSGNPGNLVANIPSPTSSGTFYLQFPISFQATTGNYLSMQLVSGSGVATWYAFGYEM